MTAQSAQSNNYPTNECTFWASERYHQLTGFFVPWLDNANGWSRQAEKYGWTNSPTPTIPSIMVLQAGVQFADPEFGHVGVVESINADGTFNTSNLNWGRTAQEKASVQNVIHSTGSGVSFVSAIPGSQANNPASDTVQVTLAGYMNDVLIDLRNRTGVTTIPGIVGPSQPIMNFMISWGHNEGGSQTNACHFNVLNTMQDETGATQCPGTLPGIKVYPDNPTGLKATVDALNNGRYGALVHALTTNDEGNLGLTHGLPMAANIAADLSVWVSGSSALKEDYVLNILQNAGVSDAFIVGGTKSRGQGVSQEQIDKWGSTVIGLGPSNQPPNPLDQIGQAFSNVNTFFGNLVSFFTNPLRLVKIVLGSLLIVVGGYLFVKEISK